MPDRVITDERRLALFRAVACLALLAAVLLAPRLCLSERSVPLVPALPGWPVLPPPLDRVVFAVLCGALIASILSAKGLRVLLVLCAVLALGDQNRWQPWLFQSAGLLAAVYLGQRDARIGLGLARLLVVATYFYAGLHKLTPSFTTEVVPWLLSPWDGWLIAGGWLAPWVEMGIGVGLLVPWSRRFAVEAAMLLHSLLIVLFSPLGHASLVLVAWNTFMLPLVALLFLGTPDLTPRDLLWPRGPLMARLLVVLFGLMPLLHIIDRHDAFLSVNLFTGNTNEGTLILPDGVWQRLDAETLRHTHEGDGGRHLDLSRWGIEDMNAPICPEHRIFLAIARTLAARAGPDTEVTLVIRERQRGGERAVRTYRVVGNP